MSKVTNAMQKNGALGQIRTNLRGQFSRWKALTWLQAYAVFRTHNLWEFPTFKYFKVNNLKYINHMDMSYVNIHSLQLSYTFITIQLSEENRDNYVRLLKSCDIVTVLLLFLLYIWISVSETFKNNFSSCERDLFLEFMILCQFSIPQ